MMLQIIFGAAAICSGGYAVASADRFFRHPRLRQPSDYALYAVGALSVLGGGYFVGLALGAL